MFTKGGIINCLSNSNKHKTRKCDNDLFFSTPLPRWLRAKTRQR